MNLCMDPHVRYVTQSSFFSSPLLGPLTNRKITQYQKQGYYTGVRVEERKKKRRGKRMTKEKLFAIFNI